MIVVPLTRIINSSILSGRFPDAWKEAELVPILKKGLPTDKNNYRPVALLSVVSKVLEMVVQNQMSEYFKTHKLLPQSQHSFRKNRSTTSALLAVTGKVATMRQRGSEVAMAAFDCLDPDILDKKLVLYGLDENSRNWVRSFLTDRRQSVRVGETNAHQQPRYQSAHHKVP